VAENTGWDLTNTWKMDGKAAKSLTTTFAFLLLSYVLLACSKNPLPYSLPRKVSVKNNKLIIISFINVVFVPIILSLPSDELTGRSSRTKKLSVDPPPSSRHLK
jgi:hypothetical protein